MLVDYSVENYRSVNDTCTLSMRASSISDTPHSNIINRGNNKLLSTAVIYGANSSGKSNIIKAMLQMKSIVLTSVKLNDNETLDYEPFLYTTEKNEPSMFEVTFIHEEKKYRYGFEITSNKIIEEWLYSTSLKRNKETELFFRQDKQITIGSSFKEGLNKQEMVNDNRLFLSLCAQLGGKTSKLIMQWFASSINIISGIDSDGYATFSRMMLHEELVECNQAKEFYQHIQLGFKDITSEEEEFDSSKIPKNIPENLREDIIKRYTGKKRVDLLSVHNVYDKNGNIVDEITSNFLDTESEGTKKLIEISGPIFDTLNGGKTLIIDELDAKLHPHITQHIINLFNNQETNQHGAQLIFSTHDTNLLASKMFRRDQIWFTEKNQKEETDLYNMMNILLPDGSKPRNDANYEKNYIAGRYGAIPYIRNY